MPPSLLDITETEPALLFSPTSIHPDTDKSSVMSSDQSSKWILLLVEQHFVFYSQPLPCGSGHPTSDV